MTNDGSDRITSRINPLLFLMIPLGILAFVYTFKFCYEAYYAHSLLSTVIGEILFFIGLPFSILPILQNRFSLDGDAILIKYLWGITKDSIKLSEIDSYYVIKGQNYYDKSYLIWSHQGKAYGIVSEYDSNIKICNAIKRNAKESLDLEKYQSYLLARIFGYFFVIASGCITLTALYFLLFSAELKNEALQTFKVHLAEAPRLEAYTVKISHKGEKEKYEERHMLKISTKEFPAYSFGVDDAENHALFIQNVNNGDTLQLTVRKRLFDDRLIGNTKFNKGWFENWVNYYYIPVLGLKHGDIDFISVEGSKNREKDLFKLSTIFCLVLGILGLVIGLLFFTIRYKRSKTYYSDLSERPQKIPQKSTSKPQKTKIEYKRKHKE